MTHKLQKKKKNLLSISYQQHSTKKSLILFTKMNGAWFNCMNIGFSIIAFSLASSKKFVILHYQNPIYLFDRSIITLKIHLIFYTLFYTPS